jgi:uncharacterized membrane protein
MLKKLGYGLVGALLFSLSLFFVYIVGYLVATQVMPAIEQGSLSVKSNIMILNILWEGNEVYIVLTVYTLLAGAFGWGAMRTIKKIKKSFSVETP